MSGSTCRCAAGGRRGGVTEIQYWQYNIHYCTGRQVGNTSRHNTVTCSTATYAALPELRARGEGRDSNPRLPLSSSWGGPLDHSVGEVVGGSGGVQPWDRPPALQGERGGWSAAVGSPTGAAWGGGGMDCSRGIAHRRRRRGGKVERSRGITHMCSGGGGGGRGGVTEIQYWQYNIHFCTGR